MKIKYEAFDGQIFDTEQECNNYEASLIPPPSMYDISGHPTDWIDAAEYIVINDERQLVHRVLSDIPEIDDTGLYKWSKVKYKTVLSNSQFIPVYNILKNYVKESNDEDEN